MSFKYDESIGRGGSAIDGPRDVSIALSYTFIDSSDEFLYVYRCGDRNFEFSAGQVKQNRQLEFGGKIVNRYVTVAIFVLEPSVREGFKAAYPAESLDGPLYEAIKVDVREGLFALDTEDVKWLWQRPDFRIQFVDSLQDVPASEPLRE